MEEGNKMVIQFKYRDTGYTIIDGVMIAHSDHKVRDKIVSSARTRGELINVGELSDKEYYQFVKAYHFKLGLNILPFLFAKKNNLKYLNFCSYSFLKF